MHPGELLDHALATLFANPRAHDAGDAPHRRTVGPVVIVAPPGTRASQCIGDFVVRSGLPQAATLPERLALWDGESLGRALAATTERHGRLATLFSSRPLVVVDDLDRLGGRDRQNLFASFLDASLAQGTAFCCSLRNHPGSANDLDPRLASRLSAGLVVTLSPATASTASTAPERPGGLSLRRVFRAAAAHHELDMDELIGPSRRRAVAAARGTAMYLARMLTAKSLYAIGAACGGRDHSTVIHAVRIVEQQITHDAVFAADIARLAGMLRGHSKPRSRNRRRGCVGVETPSLQAAELRASWPDKSTDHG